MTDVLYRYNVQRWSLGVDQFDEPIPGCRLEVRCDEYPVLRRTAKGAWIDVCGAQRFVLMTARKQYACETPVLAAESFRARKASQLRILRAQIAEAEKALRLLESATKGQRTTESATVTSVGAERKDNATTDSPTTSENGI